MTTNLIFDDSIKFATEISNYLNGELYVQRVYSNGIKTITVNDVEYSIIVKKPKDSNVKNIYISEYIAPTGLVKNLQTVFCDAFVNNLTTKTCQFELKHVYGLLQKAFATYFEITLFRDKKCDPLIRIEDSTFTHFFNIANVTVTDGSSIYLLKYINTHEECDDLEHLVEKGSINDFISMISKKESELDAQQCNEMLFGIYNELNKKNRDSLVKVLRNLK